LAGRYTAGIASNEALSPLGRKEAINKMRVESEQRRYSKSKRRINILGLVVFASSSLIFILAITWTLNSAWTEWWVVPSSLLLGFVVALVSSIVMDHALDKRYGRVRLSLRDYILIQFRFLLVIFLTPVAISFLISLFFANASYWKRDPFLLLPRTLAFVALVLFSGYVFPYLLSRIKDAERTKSQELTSIVNDVSKKIGVSVQGIYEVPLRGLRTANAAQVGFIEGRKSIFVIGEWENHFTKDEMGAILAHEFAHAKHNHLRKLIVVQTSYYVGVPGLLFVFTSFFMKVFQIPKPAPIWVVVVLISLALVLVAAAHLFAQWVSRRYETEADLEAATVCGSAPLISALLKLAELNMIPKQRSNPLSTHPSIESRIKALEALNTQPTLQISNPQR
jgi:Zn-dependent protease with chaperone function